MGLESFQTRSSELAPYHLRDDWGDNALTGRTNASTLLHYDPQRRSVAGRMVAGQYRPPWRVLNTGPSARNQRLEHNYETSGDGLVTTASEQVLGDWELTYRWLTRATSPSPDVLEVDCIAPHPRSGAPRWYLTINSAGNADLMRSDGTTTTRVIDGRWTANTRQHTILFRREPDCRLRLYVDGISQGTTRDPFLPQAETTSLRFTQRSTSRVAIQNMEVR